MGDRRRSSKSAPPGCCQGIIWMPAQPSLKICLQGLILAGQGCPGLARYLYQQGWPDARLFVVSSPIVEKDNMDRIKEDARLWELSEVAVGAELGLGKDANRSATC